MKDTKILFAEASDGEIPKLVDNAGNKKKSTKYPPNAFELSFLLCINKIKVSYIFLRQSLLTKLLRYSIFIQFLSWRKEKRFQNTLENMESMELYIFRALRRLFVEARKVERKPYSRNTMKAIRVGLDRFLSCSPHRKTFSIICDK